MGYKVEADFMHNGNRCVVVAQEAGHRCGYVGIDKNNLLYEKEYSEKISDLKFSEIENDPVGKRGILSLVCADVEDGIISPELFFNVHGGITYSGGGKGSEYPVNSDLWWFGYDCAHYGDCKDFSIMDERHREMENRYPYYDFDDVIRTKEYCIEECKSLSDQLSKFVV